MLRFFSGRVASDGHPVRESSNGGHVSVSQTHSDKVRRAIVDDPPDDSGRPTGRTARAYVNWWRRGLALTAVSGITIAAAVTFGTAATASGGTAFANPLSLNGAGIDQAREQNVDREAVRPELSVDELAERRSTLIASTAAQIEEGHHQAVLESRKASLKDAATAVEAEAERLRNLANFLWPTAGGVSSEWGRRLHPILRYYRPHGGVDIGGACEQPIYAAQSGTVTKVDAGGYNGGSGNNTRIDHGDINGIHVETGYLHMSKIYVKVGQEVDKGERIGTVGNTGLSTGCHLHLSLYKNGANRDPLEYVHKDNSTDGAAKDESSD